MLAADRCLQKRVNCLNAALYVRLVDGAIPRAWRLARWRASCTSRLQGWECVPGLRLGLGV